MQFKDNSAACKEALRQAQKAMLYEIGELIYSAIFPLIPTDTTALKTSLGYKVNEAEMSVTIGVNTEYAVWVEFGTGIYAENGQGRKGGWAYKDEDGKTIFTMGMRAQPYMRPGYKSVKKQIEKRCQEILGQKFKVRKV